MGLFDALAQLDKCDNLAEYCNTPTKTQILTTHRPTDQVEPSTALLSKATFSLPNISFSFLKPCPQCHGRDYTYSSRGSIHCATCEPEVIGHAIHATGEIEEYSPQHDKSAPDRLAKLLEEKRSKNLEQARDCFEIGYLWVTDHLEELLQTGWTRPELFRRSRHRWPAGNWGLAWLSVWQKPGVKARVTRRGSVEFTFSSGERKILQTALPVVRQKRVN